MYKLIFFPALLLSAALTAQQPAQVTVQGDAKVGLIVTGTGNTINTTQIFGKSPEYAELKKRLDGLAATIGKKAGECEQMRRDSLPARYRDGCRAELIALNAERDSVQKIETRFREDVIRLAETFASIPLNSERLRLAKQLFEEGKVREADNVLKAREMKQEGDALLSQKERHLAALMETDSLLRIKADEFALKAQLKATDYTDSLRYDSAEYYFAQSLRYAEKMENLKGFAALLSQYNQNQRAVGYYEKALRLARSQDEEAKLSMNLGGVYQSLQKMPEAEKMFLYTLDVYERLAAGDSAQFAPALARSCMNLGIFYRATQKTAESEKMYLRAFNAYERMVKNDPARIEPDLARACLNLGNLYRSIQKMKEAESMYRRSLEIRERLVKSDPVQFEPDLALTALNMGILYSSLKKMSEAEKMYLRSLEIRERLAKNDPAQFEPDLAQTSTSLGNFYRSLQKMDEAEKMYLRSLDIRERLAKGNPAQFEPDYARACMNLGIFFSNIRKMDEAEKMYLRGLNVCERLVSGNAALFEPDLAQTCMNMGNFYSMSQKTEAAEKMYLRSLGIYERLAQSAAAQFEPKLALTCMNLAEFYADSRRTETAFAFNHRSLTIYERLAQKNPAQFEFNVAYSLYIEGLINVRQRAFPEAQRYYDRSLALFQKIMLAGQTYNKPYFLKLNENMADLRDSFTLRRDYPAAAAIQRSRALCLDTLRAADNTLLQAAASAYDTLARLCLFDRQYNEAATAAEKALSLHLSENTARANLGHSHLLRGDWDKAKAIYEQYLAGEKDSAQSKTGLLRDWEAFEAAGIVEPEITKAKAWIKG